MNNKKEKPSMKKVDGFLKTKKQITYFDFRTSD